MRSQDAYDIDVTVPKLQELQEPSLLNAAVSEHVSLSSHYNNADGK
jgi:hypothetical protein